MLSNNPGPMIRCTSMAAPWSHRRIVSVGGGRVHGVGLGPVQMGTKGTKRVVNIDGEEQPAPRGIVQAGRSEARSESRKLPRRRSGFSDLPGRSHTIH